MTGQVRPITDFNERPEPVIAAHYKFAKWVDDVNERNPMEPWMVLNMTRYMLGLPAFHQDGVSYQEMRDYIKRHNERWGL